MGVIASYDKQDDGNFTIVLKDMTFEEASYIFNLMNNKALVDAQTENDEPEVVDEETPGTVLGRMNIMCAGPFAGEMIQDIYDRMGYNGLAQLLAYDPNLNEHVCDDAQYKNGMIYMTLRYLQEVDFFIVSNCDDKSPVEFIEAFQQYMKLDETVDEIRKMEREERKAKCLAYKDQFVSRIAENAVKLSDDIDVILDKTIVPDGEYKGKEIETVFAEYEIAGIGNLLRQKSKIGEECFSHAKKLLSVILRYAETTITFEDFIHALIAFFPKENADALLALDQEARKDKYHELVKQLLARMG